MKQGYLVLGLFVILSCSRGTDCKEVTKRDSEGSLISVICYQNDTLKHGPAKYYYKNGDLREEFVYENNKVDGIYKSYWQGGTIESQVHFVNGIQEGEALWFSEKGVLESRSYWVEGIQFGSAYYFSPNGNVRSYSCTDYAGKNFALAEYDSVGGLKHFEGDVFGSHSFLAGFDSANVVLINKPVQINIAVAEPPTTTTIITVKLVDPSGQTTDFGHLDIENGVAGFSPTLNQVGTYNISVWAEIRNLDNSTIKTDKGNIQAIVIPPAQVDSSPPSLQSLPEGTLRYEAEISSPGCSQC